MKHINLKLKSTDIGTYQYWLLESDTHKMKNQMHLVLFDCSEIYLLMSLYLAKRIWYFLYLTNMLELAQ